MLEIDAGMILFRDMPAFYPGSIRDSELCRIIPRIVVLPVGETYN